MCSQIYPLTRSFPIADSTADTAAQTFVNGWFSSFGVPSTITILTVVNSLNWTNGQLMNLLGTNRIQITAYYPIANCLVKCFHHQLKGVLKCMTDPTHWTKALPLIRLGIRTAVKQDLQYTPAELVYGSTLWALFPGELFDTHTTLTTAKTFTPFP